MQKSYVVRWTVAGITLAFILTVLFYHPVGYGLRTGIGAISSWVVRPFSMASRSTHWALQSGRDAVGAWRQIGRLREVEEKFFVQSVEYARLAEEVEALKRALDIRARASRPTKTAEILGSFSEGRDEFLIITQTDNAEIREGAIVLSLEGVLIGIVRTVSSHTATVRLIESPSETLTVSVHPSGVNGVLKGDNNGEYIISLVPKDANVNMGDTVSAEGRNLGIPGGTPVGVVVEVERSPTESFLMLRAKAPFDLYTISDVMVVLEP